MKVSIEALERLWELQNLIFEQRRLIAEAKELSSGEALNDLEMQITKQNEVLRNLQATTERLQDEKRKLESDIELVEKRIVTDNERIGSSTSTKDIAGFQSELEALRSRKELLEDSELGLLEELEQFQSKLGEEKIRKQQLEEALSEKREALANELGQMKNYNQSLSDQIAQIRSELGSELIAKFDSRLSRGNAVGRIVRSACNACNMNLTSTAMAEISKVPTDELASCPECNAIVIRQ